ncbi:KilA domain-containing protein [Glaesserella parasuis 29755]|uniref:P22AR C-terminal domain-containing protein n=1 Tax=Glaesserella parasuis TaxID=738 RepID=UPI000165B3C3|nr:P22AR C-terminal domain-containing protein [Glaesserella parasuis]AWY45566.1 bacteriocin [Glaesserella parasuis 29755]EQA95127.1 kilA-N domain protein [Glaesserella parasuis 29755]MDD2155661.1 KilA-N domain-containing protein [Glaesserella parasuis]MDG6274630.1 P22AR C-terminal domain-containing protein [Glaesserella parasuis]MDG6278819.1 P22AR C-terminal domain-containing protein [Glaesserella parasuis]
MSNLTILKTSIGQLDNLFNLKDLHRVSGNEAKHEPYRFVRLDTTKELIEEIQKEDPTTQPLKTLRGTQGGTYACEELALAYAMWISPKFHLVVLRAFLAMHKGELQNQQQNQPLVKPEVRYPASFTGAEIYSLVWLLISHRNMNDLLGELEQPLAAIGSNFHPAVYSHHREYKRLIDENLPILKRLIEPFKESNPIEFERIKSRLKLN